MTTTLLSGSQQPVSMKFLWYGLEHRTHFWFNVSNPSSQRMLLFPTSSCKYCSPTTQYYIWNVKARMLACTIARLLEAVLIIKTLVVTPFFLLFLAFAAAAPNILLDARQYFRCGCGLVGYTKATAVYYFDSSSTRSNWAACSAYYKADSKCKSFGFGEANCMLFDVLALNNTNLNPTSPYTFYEASCLTKQLEGPCSNALISSTTPPTTSTTLPTTSTPPTTRSALPTTRTTLRTTSTKLSSTSTKPCTMSSKRVEATKRRSHQPEQKLKKWAQAAQGVQCPFTISVEDGMMGSCRQDTQRVYLEQSVSGKTMTTML
ncbi:hypothetical protein P154DRAFT_539604 [Amniculicola lignicola CBS 123094]|uniref:Apple domain-containing protein n=1 Tax=Amniculicola lignicola CBS 123094 TaxID=1392246 RepID=A0A6A5VX91_9PLEO|nr:hypothetical protein P154DRAFT_539604 [Amniculicola lignicola CBS 123094]